VLEVTGAGDETTGAGEAVDDELLELEPPPEPTTRLTTVVCTIVRFGSELDAWAVDLSAGSAPEAICQARPAAIKTEVNPASSAVRIASESAERPRGRERW
jgi:hypothetical protein